MLDRHRLVFRIATGTGILGLTLTSGIVLLANRFVDDFSSPHKVLGEEQFTWKFPPTPPEPPPSLQRPLMFTTSDGKLLCGEFWAQPRPAPTVVLCHGYRISRQPLRPVAAIEYQDGYNVMLFDFRGHGDSDSVITSGGRSEVHDLEAALEVASMQPETLASQVIIHGFSMGAAIALLTPPHPSVAAIIADSPYARSDEVVRRLVHYYLTIESSSWSHPLDHLRPLFPAVAWATVVASILIYRLRFGYNYVARPDTSFKRQGGRARKQAPRQIPILLIHGVADELIPISHSRQIAAQAQAYNYPLETYFIEGAGHCEAYEKEPERYSEVIHDFLSRRLPGKSPQ